MKRQVWLTTLIGMLAVACGDDVAGTSDTDTDTEGTTSTTAPTTDPSTSSSSGDPDTTDTETDTSESTSSSTGDPTGESSSSTTDDTNTGEPVDFMITIENISDQGPLPTPFSPGVWIEQDASVAPVFTLNQPASEALELLAEDGDPSTLATEIDGLGGGVIQSGVFDTPVDGAEAAPIMPGESYEVMFTAQPGSRLGLASMMVGTNDVFWATGPQGVALYQGNGDPVNGEITTFLNLFDAGTEANQPPEGGAYQPQGGLGADVGPEESGVISMRNESTHHIVGSRRLLDIDVEYVIDEEMMVIEGLMFTFTNISDSTGGFESALSPITWALHNDSVSLITPGGSAADLAGLEALAEDGDGTALEATLGNVAAVDQNGIAGMAPIAPGESVSFMITPNEGSEIFSFATMVVESNDAVIAVEPQGVPLLGEDMDGNVVYRNPDSIANDLIDLMEVWDIGTEANETPGAGANTATLQAAPNTGAADPDATIRYYNDPTNDLADITNDIEVLVSGDEVSGDVDISILNLSEGGAYQFTISPGVSAMTPAGTPLFAMGEAAGAGLEALAEDGDPTTFETELDAATDGETQTVLAIPPDDLETISLTATSSANPVFHFAAMIVPSNDTYLATGPDGVNLYNGDTLLPDEEIEAAILASLQVYDAGTEQNQAAARGRDMAPLQSGPNVGENEGSGLVRIVTAGANGSLDNEPVWEYPRLDQLIRVTLTPVR